MTVIVEKQLSTSTTFQALADRVTDLEAGAGSGVVHDTGNETVAGVKTFSSSPIVPTPSSSTQAANKSYVDSVGGGGTVINNTVNLTGGNMVALSGYASLAAACTAIGSTVRTPLLVDSDKNVATLTTVTANILLVYGGGKLTITTGSIVFQGQGLADPESQLPIIYGADPGDVTWSGTVYPKRLSTALWDTGNTHILDKVKLADAAVSGKVCTLLLYEGLITGGTLSTDAAEVTTNHHILVMGEITNTWDTPGYYPFLMNSYTSFRSVPGVKIYESSVAGIYNMALITAKHMQVAGAAGTNTHIWVENNWFVGDAGQGGSGGPSTVILGNTDTGGINYNRFDRTHGYNTLGGYATTGNYANNATFLGNNFIGCGTQVCAVINGKNIRIADNYWDQRNSNATTAYTCLDLEPNVGNEFMENILIENNTFDVTNETFAAYAIQFLPAVGTAIKNVTIRNNTIYCGDIGPGVGSNIIAQGITVQNTLEAYVYGNTIRGATQAAMIFQGCRDVTAWDNHVIGSFRGMKVIATANSRFYDNHLVYASMPSYSQIADITEYQLNLPVTTSGTTIHSDQTVGWNSLKYALTFIGGTVTINNSDYTLTAYTDNYTMTAGSSIGTLAQKTFVPADVTAATDNVHIVAHGYANGAKVYLDATAGTLPAHTAPSVDPLFGFPFYWIIRVDADNIKFANSLANALAGTAIDLTNTGTTGPFRISPIMTTKFASNTYADNEAPDGHSLLASGSSTIVSTYHDQQVTNVADAAHTATTAEGIIVYTSLTAGRTVNLPDATTCRGKEFTVKDGAGTAGSNNITWDGFGSQTIDGSSTKAAVSTNWGFGRIKSNGTGWLTV